MKDYRFSAIIGALIASGVLAACDGPDDPAMSEDSRAYSPECTGPTGKVIRVDGGEFVMGANPILSEEGPERLTQVDGFWIDQHEVSNAQFAKFVAETGYVTQAEKPVDPAEFGAPVDEIPPSLLMPGSAVFIPPDGGPPGQTEWWQYVPGAYWRKPDGPDGPDARADLPVVHLAREDMEAYARWRSGRLPSEAEWEYAASARQEETTEQPANDEANSWQGVFPLVNEQGDGFAGLAPVGCYKPNDRGLLDMIGNAWEATSDHYGDGLDPDDRTNPRGPSEATAYDSMNLGPPRFVIKGGSFLCAPNYCRRYRPSARQGRDPGLGSSNVGFRLVYDAKPER